MSSVYKFMLKDYKKKPCFNVMLASIHLAFNPVKAHLNKKDTDGVFYTTELLLNFLKSPIVQATIDCSDLFEHDKLIYEFKKRNNLLSEDERISLEFETKEQHRKMLALESIITTRRRRSTKKGLTNSKEIQRYIQAGQELRKLDLLGVKVQDSSVINFT